MTGQRLWAPILFYAAGMIVISTFSTSILSPECLHLLSTSRFLGHLLPFVPFGWLSCRYFSQGIGIGGAGSALLAASVSALLGLVDEFNQTFMEGRGPEIADALAGVSGGSLGAIIFSGMASLKSHFGKTRAAFAGRVVVSLTAVAGSAALVCAIPSYTSVFKPFRASTSSIESLGSFSGSGGIALAVTNMTRQFDAIVTHLTRRDRPGDNPSSGEEAPVREKRHLPLPHMNAHNQGGPKEHSEHRVVGTGAVGDSKGGEGRTLQVSGGPATNKNGFLGIQPHPDSESRQEPPLSLEQPKQLEWPQVASQTRSQGTDHVLLETARNAGREHLGRSGSVRHRGPGMKDGGRDVPVLMVHPSNPVQKLTMNQTHKILTGEYTNWNQVGGLDRPVRPMIVDKSNVASGSIHERFLDLACQEVARLPVTTGVLGRVASDEDAVGFVPPCGPRQLDYLAQHCPVRLLIIQDE